MRERETEREREGERHTHSKGKDEKKDMRKKACERIKKDKKIKQRGK